MDTLSSKLTESFISKLELLDIKYNNTIFSNNHGQRKSKQKGFSTDFSDFKNYNIGDDLKRVDWNSYARFDKLYIKQFDAERQADYAILLDSSKSMDFGDNNKLIYSKLIAASLIYIITKSSDSVDLYNFSDSINLINKNISSKVQFKSIVKNLEQIEASGYSNLGLCIEEIISNKIKNNTVFIISDFLYNQDYEQYLKKLGYNNNIVLIQILAEEEINPNLKGNYRLYDSESNEKMDVLVDDCLIDSYKENLKNLEKYLSDFCAKYNSIFLSTSTNKNPLDFILQVLFS